MLCYATMYCVMIYDVSVAMLAAMYSSVMLYDVSVVMLWYNVLLCCVMIYDVSIAMLWYNV